MPAEYGRFPQLFTGSAGCIRGPKLEYVRARTLVWGGFMRSAPSAARLLVYFLAMAPVGLSLVGCEEPHVAHNSALCADCQKRKLEEECKDNQPPEPIRNLREPMTAMVGPDGGLSLPAGVQPRDFFRGENSDPAALRADQFRTETKADGLHIIALDKCRASAEFFLARPGSNAASGPGVVAGGVVTGGSHAREPALVSAPTVGSVGGCAGGVCPPSGTATAGGLLEKPVLPVTKAPDTAVASTDKKADVEKGKAHAVEAAIALESLVSPMPMLPGLNEIVKRLTPKEAKKPKLSDDPTPGEPDGKMVPPT